MESWRLIDLGEASPLVAQAFYEAVAKAVDNNLSPNTVILVQPSTPYVCVGFHQEIEREINMDYCKGRNLPVIRRSQGGGTVYLDSNQIFYQVVARGESSVIPLQVGKLFEKLLAVTVYVYRNLGIPAEFKPLNDVVVNGRKISGNGAGKYGLNTSILVGNIILDIDYESMADSLNVPSEKFRDKMAKSMREWVTSLKRELGYIPSIEEVKRLLIEGYEQILKIKLVKSEETELEKKIWEDEIKPKHLSEDWLNPFQSKRGIGKDSRTVKIAGDVKVVQVDHKAAKLIRIRAELAQNKIFDIMISGDFFMLPEEGVKEIESALKGKDLNTYEILQVLERAYKNNKIQTPGITPNDFCDAIMKLKEIIV